MAGRADLAMRPVPSLTGRAPTIYSTTATLSPLVFMASKPHRFTCRCIYIYHQLILICLSSCSGLLPHRQSQALWEPHVCFLSPFTMATDLMCAF